jgi:hypothetical protein
MAPVHPGKTNDPKLMDIFQNRRTKFAMAKHVINKVVNKRVVLSLIMYTLGKVALNSCL